MRWDTMGPGDSSRDLPETADQPGSDSAQGPKEDTTAEGQTPGSPRCNIQSTPPSKPVDPPAPFLQRGDSDKPLGHSRRSRTWVSGTTPTMTRMETPLQNLDSFSRGRGRSLFAEIKEGPELGSPPRSLGTRPRERSPPGAAPPDPDPDPDSGSAPPAPRRVPGPRTGSLPRAPRAPPCARRDWRAPARNKAGGGAAPYLRERRVRRGDGRSRPGAEQRSSARAGRPPGSPPRPPQGPLEAARAIATAAPGRRSPGLSAQPCGRRAGPPPPGAPVRLRAPPCAPGTSPEGPPRGGLTRGPLLREFTRRKSSERTFWKLVVAMKMDLATAKV
uniref:basic salivary proline-rich protein 1-like n=1 Tax=Halichoerus grypus TaxID=9711 RepID=UPI001659BA10|nr:basic salivary proline-rich protein 1-like [Halichoerus grypus]